MFPHEGGKIAALAFSNHSQILKPEWKPDYGPAEFVPRWGATMSGAHVYLIAYNINLLSTKEQAHRIALDIREKGRGKDKVRKKQPVLKSEKPLTLLDSCLWELL